MRKDFMTHEEYCRKCRSKKYQITDTSKQQTLIKLLHDLGIVLSFRDDEKHKKLRDTNILKPDWATQAIYKIINDNQLFKNKGVLETRNLSTLLDAKRYPTNQHQTLLELMTKFELCFQMSDTEHESYLITDLLTPQEPELNWNDDDCLQFEYLYEVLPNSIFSRFLARAHNLIAKRTYWLTGVMLQQDNNKALIKADIEDKKISIAINGTLTTRRALLSVIRYHFNAIHSSFSNLNPQAFIPYKNGKIAYDELLNLERNNITEHFFADPKINAKLNVQILLNGIVTIEERKQDSQKLLGDRHLHIHGDVYNSNFNQGDNGEQNME